MYSVVYRYVLDTFFCMYNMQSSFLKNNFRIIPLGSVTGLISY